jgi:hypothetical protein
MRHQADLSVSENTDDSAVLFDTSKILIDDFLLFSVQFGVFSESFLLRRVPVLIESSSAFVSQVASPDSSEATQTLRSFDITDDANDNNRRSFNDSDGFDDLFLVELSAWSIKFSDNVGHASLISHEGSQVGLLGDIVLREGFDFASEVASSLAGGKAEMAVTWALEFTV